jgi:hypothetical protein
LWLNSGVDIDEYLPQETKKWCIQQLSMHKIDIRALHSGDVVSDGSRAHVQAYACLRHIVREHIANHIAPLLLESPKPIGGYESVEIQGGALLDIVQDNAEFVRMQDNQDYIRNVEGILVTERENPNLFEDLEYTDISNS